MLNLSAYAKINLTLEVLCKRVDGYHQISSILQTISISDDLAFEPASDLTFYTTDTDVLSNPFIEASVMSSAKMLQQETGCRLGARIGLIRQGIPPATGLGSSSSIPAAVLKALNKIWSLNLSVEQLRSVAAKLGSDTPFFISGGTALAEGRGEQITLLSPLPKMWLVLLIPNVDPVPNKTAKMFSMLNSELFTLGDLTKTLVDKLKSVNLIEMSMFHNAFEDVARRYFLQFDLCYQNFIECGANSVQLAGSGPALFTIVTDEKEGDATVSRLSKRGFTALLAHTIQLDT